MIKKLIFAILLLVNASASAATNDAATQAFEVFCYHEVRDSVDGDLEQDTSAWLSSNKH
jgi:biofilm PGA synthesis lipoprotein PgaB